MIEAAEHEENGEEKPRIEDRKQRIVKKGIRRAPIILLYPLSSILYPLLSPSSSVPFVVSVVNYLAGGSTNSTPLAKSSSNSITIASGPFFGSG